jgi:red chlorophyll catabolite reductase
MCAPFSAQARRTDAVARMPPLAHREVMLALAGEAEAALGTRLLPSEVPADVTQFRNAAGNAFGSVDVRRGVPGSSVRAQLLHMCVGARATSIDVAGSIVFMGKFS